MFCCQLYRLNSLAHLSEGILEIVFYLDIYIVDKFCCSTGVMFGTEHCLSVAGVAWR